MTLFVQPKELNDTEKKLFILKSYSPTFIKMNILSVELYVCAIWSMPVDYMHT